MISGITVKLYVKTPISGTDDPSRDPFNRQLYTETTANVDNVLVGQPTTDDIIDSADLQGKKIEYVLGIPKGDTHVWNDTKVEFFGRVFQTYGMPVMGIEANVPTPWHKKVYVVAYE